jgi:hypothetical protein
MQELPILVADWDAKHPATMLACERGCGFERHCTSDEMGISELVAHCPRCYDRTGAYLDWKYQVGSTCSACGKLDWEMPIQVSRAPWVAVCSRKCQLQHEYAASLNPHA